MKTRAIEPSQHSAAKLVGALYLATMATAIFAQIGVRDRLIVRGDAVQSALNLVAHERLFRLGVRASTTTARLDKTSTANTAARPQNRGGVSSGDKPRAQSGMA